MRLLVAAVLLVPALANAQPGAQPAGKIQATTTSTSPEVLGLARGAHSAGARGDCFGARTLAAQVARLDRDFYDAVISTDLSITQCKPKPRIYAVDREEPIPQGPRAVAMPMPTDSGRNLGGQLLLGSVMGAGLGLLGAVTAASGDGDDLGGMLVLGSLGLVIGSTAGVVLAGDNAGSDYSLGLTLAGSSLGTILGWKILLSNASDFDSPAVALGILVGAPTLGAMMGFNASRRTLYPAASTQVALPAAPRISDPTTTLTILDGNF